MKKTVFNKSLLCSFVLLALVAGVIVGCGSSAPPEISEDVATDVAAEDAAIFDEESEL
jgi:hypothetical protein